jgi:preprotein translocase subunit SecB
VKPSALQLKQYIVTELSIAANRSFDPEKKVSLGMRDVVAEPECRADEKNPRQWQIFLRLKHSQNMESNSPYFFMIEMAGFFTVGTSVSDDQVMEFAKVNGASVLYSTAREILRSMMAMGPYLPILLPAVSFFDPAPKAGEKKALEAGTVQAAKVVAPKAAGKKKGSADKA